MLLTRRAQALRAGSNFLARPSTRRMTPRALASLVCLGALGLAPACLNREIAPIEPKTTKGTVATLKQTRVDKIDLLLAIDNSKSMADKQVLLSEAVPHLVDQLLHPKCIDPTSDPLPPVDVPSGDPCPTVDKDGVEVAMEREFEPVRDIHVGIISSSLGSLDGGSCGGAIYADDKAQLIDRLAEDPPDDEPDNDAHADTGGKHFLLWDPDGKYGEPTNEGVFEQTLTDMVIGVGDRGCGFEMPLESVYRFLVDPAPYDTLEADESSPARYVPAGVDQALLDQRAEFLRPDSLVAIVMLSDENDCSVKTGHGYLSITGFLARGTTICETNPNDKCCYSCSAKEIPDGCEPDPVCAGEDSPPPVPDQENLYCWNQKQRMGTDQLYPVARYANALRLPKIDPAQTTLVPENSKDGVPNPLLDGRPEDFIFFAGIVGVPWQALARKNGDGEADLTLGYMTVPELQENGDILGKLTGDPDAHEPPSDPFMIESLAARAGTSEILGLSPASANIVNGGDRSQIEGDENLQYACIYEDDVVGGTDCTTCEDCDNPVCDGTTQVRARAYPGVRQLALVNALGRQGIAASVCPVHTDETATPFGYDPAVGAIIDVLKDKLKDQQCLDFSIKPNDEGQVTCVVMESRVDDACSCDLPGRTDPVKKHLPAIDAIQASFSWDQDETCFCEVDQLAEDSLKTCQEEAIVPEGIDGWCYIDAGSENPVGNPDLVRCKDPARNRSVRVVGDPRPHNGATLHIFCAGEPNE